MARFRSHHAPCLTRCPVGQTLSGLEVGLVLTDPAGEIIWLNDSAERLLGVKAETTIGKPIHKALVDPRLISFWHDAAETHQSSSVEIGMDRPAPFLLKISAVECTDPNGQIIGRALLLYDVSKERTVQIQLSQAVARRLVEQGGRSRTSQPVNGLTRRETRILRAVGQGLSNQDISEQFDITMSTVRSHLKNINRKLGLRSRAEAVSYAARNPLL